VAINKVCGILGSFLVLSAGTIGHQAENIHGHTNANRGRNLFRPVEVSLPVLQKTCTFPLVTLGLPMFSLIDSRSVELPAGYLGKNSTKAQVVMLVYSHIAHNRKGGVMSMYEAAPQKGIPPEEMIKKIADAHIFRDVSHAGPWAIRPMVIKGATIIGPGCTVPEALEDVATQVKR
jgi:hypothetical protein